MKDYKRLTDKYYFDCNKCVDGECSTPDIFCQYRYRCEIYNSLHSLEDKIESGELISTKQEDAGEQEVAFFAEHNDGVRKLFADDLKDRLQADLAHSDITQEAYEVIVGEINYCLGEVEG